jgi:hypothetical protein
MGEVYRARDMKLDREVARTIKWDYFRGVAFYGPSALLYRSIMGAIRLRGWCLTRGK